MRTHDCRPDRSLSRRVRIGAVRLLRRRQRIWRALFPTARSFNDTIYHLDIRGTSHVPSGLLRQRAEGAVSLDHGRVREARRPKQLRQPLVLLPRIGCEAKGDFTTGFRHPSHFSQSSRRVRPDLHGVDCQRLIKGIVIERQVLHRAAPEVDTTILDGGCIPRELAPPSPAMGRYRRCAPPLPALTAAE